MIRIMVSWLWTVDCIDIMRNTSMMRINYLLKKDEKEPNLFKRWKLATVL